MPNLFDQTNINGMVLANRFIRSATWEGMATDEGSVTPPLIRLVEELARGGVGLIISSHAFVSPEGRAGPWQLAVCKDDFVPGLSEMTERVRAAGGKIILQISHAGRFAPEKLSGLTPLGVSVGEREKTSLRELTLPEIKKREKRPISGRRPGSLKKKSPCP